MAKTKQKIEEEKMQVQVVERSQQITLQEQEITRKEKELEAKVKKPADAEKYKLEKLAEAERLAKLLKKGRNKTSYIIHWTSMDMFWLRPAIDMEDNWVHKSKVNA